MHFELIYITRVAVLSRGSETAQIQENTVTEDIIPYGLLWIVHRPNISFMEFLFWLDDGHSSGLSDAIYSYDKHYKNKSTCMKRKSVKD